MGNFYNISVDFSQNNDLAAKNPDKLKEMQGAVLIGGGKAPGLPMDYSVTAATSDTPSERDSGTIGLHFAGENVGIPAANALTCSIATTRSPPISPFRWRRGRHDRDHGRTLRRLRSLPAERAACFVYNLLI